MPRPPLQLAGALGHDVADKRLEILRRVGESGSISQAARDAGVSYKAAWQALDTLSNLAGTSLVARAVGGAGGGGASLTAAGAQLLQAADEVAAARRQALGRMAARAPGVAALGLRTSMRNQLPCTVAGVQAHGPLCLVALALPGELFLQSRITAESAQLLGLEPGLPVLALCKATAVMVQAAGPGAPAANQLAGRARRIARGAVGDEVAAELDGAGLQMVGFAAAGSGVRTRSRVWLAIEPAAVVIALAG